MADFEFKLFDCPRHASLRLTEATCAGMWNKARVLPAKAIETVMKCRGCPIGARHAGRPVEASQPLPKTVRLCPRCSKTAMKFVGDLCISCYNREGEVLRGRNARGTKPVKLQLYTFNGLVVDEHGDVTPIKLDRVAHTLEALLRVLRRRATPPEAAARRRSTTFNALEAGERRHVHS